MSDEDLLGRKTMVAFASTDCPHCTDLLRQIPRWELNKVAGDPGFVIFADGEPEEHKSLGIESPILVDPNTRWQNNSACGAPVRRFGQRRRHDNYRNRDRPAAHLGADRRENVTQKAQEFAPNYANIARIRKEP